MFDITQHKTPDGAWRCSTIFNGRLVTRVYFGYTKTQAVSLFRKYLVTIGESNV
jgi:hypothetical protein